MSTTKTIDLRGLNDKDRDHAINAAIAKHILGKKLYYADGKHGTAWCGGCGLFSAGGKHLAFSIIARKLHGSPCVEEIPLFSTSLDAVMPLLEKWHPWSILRSYLVSNEPSKAYQAMVWKKGIHYYGHGSTPAIAACMVILTANGIEVLL